MQLVCAFLFIAAGFSVTASAQDLPAVPEQPTTSTVADDVPAAAPAESTGAVIGTVGESTSSDSRSVVASFGDLVSALPDSVRGCMEYMGAQRPKERTFKCDQTSRDCEKSQGRLPMFYEVPDGKQVPHEVQTEKDEKDLVPPFEAPRNDVTLASCIAHCTVERSCNFITYQIATNTTGECYSYKISADCHMDQNDDDCFVPPETERAIGVNLGECLFSAKPEGGLSHKGWALFRKVRSSTSEALAAGASVVTILTAVIGAPFTIASRLFKA